MARSFSDSIRTVAILGGGPTASTLAILLARAGLRVGIWHKPKAAPLIVGESLVPAIIPMLGARAVQNRLVAFGIRQRDKTPKELERDESSRIHFPGTLEVTDREGQVKK